MTNKEIVKELKGAVKRSKADIKMLNKFMDDGEDQSEEILYEEGRIDALTYAIGLLK